MYPLNNLNTHFCLPDYNNLFGGAMVFLNKTIETKTNYNLVLYLKMY